MSTSTQADTSWKSIAVARPVNAMLVAESVPPTKLPLSRAEMDASLQSAGNWASLKPTDALNEPRCQAIEWLTVVLESASGLPGDED